MCACRIIVPAKDISVLMLWVDLSVRLGDFLAYPSQNVLFDWQYLGVYHHQSVGMMEMRTALDDFAEDVYISARASPSVSHTANFNQSSTRSAHRANL